MKKMIPICLFILACCSSGTKGVTLSFIQDAFNLPTAKNPTVVNLDDSGACPKIEFDSTNITSFQVRIAPDNPTDTQSTFKYSDDKFDQEGETKTLEGKNDSGSVFTLTFDNDVTYSLEVDYNCSDATDPHCVNTTFTCSGPLVE